MGVGSGIISVESTVLVRGIRDGAEVAGKGDTDGDTDTSFVTEMSSGPLDICTVAVVGRGVEGRIISAELVRGVGDGAEVVGKADADGDGDG